MLKFIVPGRRDNLGIGGIILIKSPYKYELWPLINPIALRKAKIAYNCAILSAIGLKPAY